MKYAIVTIALFAFAWLTPVKAQTPEGVAVEIVYDTSGSMGEKVLNSKGDPEPKYLIANRAILQVLYRLEDYSKSNPSKTIEVGLITFNNGDPKEVGHYSNNGVGKFTAYGIRKTILDFDNPGGGTPLGLSIDLAGDILLRSPLTHKHILMVTDGQNTVGPSPEAMLVDLQKKCKLRAEAIDTHMIGLDVSRGSFNAVKPLVATLVEASNEKQLGTQFDFILKQKILLEDEEPPTTGGK